MSRLLDVMERLRKDCPWDREQTTESLRTNTLEEVYELSDAILSGRPEEIKKELGDVLLHIVFYSTIGEEQGTFDLCDVANALCDKLIYRHPHVYGEAVAASAGAVVERWEELKQQEKGGNKTVLSGVPTSLPTLIKAYRIQDKARGVGFDWEQPEDVWTKVDEELRELREAKTPKPSWATSSSASSTSLASTASIQIMRLSERMPSSSAASAMSRRRRRRLAAPCEI